MVYYYPDYGSLKVLFQASIQNNKNLWSKKKGIQLKQPTIFAHPEYHNVTYYSEVCKAYLVHFFQGHPQKMHASNEKVFNSSS